MTAPGKKVSLSWAKGKAWDALSVYVRLRDSLRTTGEPDRCLCVTCGREYPSFGVGCLQAGHFLPGRHASVIYDERQVHGQCYNCNMRLKGNWANYYSFMKARYGQAVIDELIALDRQTKNWMVYELLEMVEEWKRKTKMLRR